MKKQALAFFLLTSFQFSSIAAVDPANVLKKIKAAATQGPVSAGPGEGGMTPHDDKVRRLQQEADAAYELKSTCDGRFNVLRFELKRTVSRSEWVSLTGGLFGVFGAVATCPHCAAIGAGIAGLANPLQQTFKDNEDTPDSYRAKLIALSERINNEFDDYRKLPAADPDSADFEKQLRARLDALMTITASCQYYESQATPTSVSK